MTASSTSYASSTTQNDYFQVHSLASARHANHDINRKNSLKKRNGQQIGLDSRSYKISRATNSVRDYSTDHV
ncbi:hypothetical protein EUGRSUZ_C04194 [Eucalyptus grandis]|uniref:Uncharacterized protein n=2 Tax=Eucalyptus grandis TaxID=71139 RepID=A0A059CXC6_EUCGR|nr:hypothetical protein EUGRSUZ_C04194 [Eucalyptus grandis]